MTGKRLVIDTSKCIGCRGCQVACKQWHGLEAEDTTFTGSYQNPPDMSGANLTVAKFTEIEDAGEVKWLIFKDMCRHCKEPLCVTACPRKAIKKKTNGIVFIKDGLCDPNACTSGEPKSCQAACPYNIPQWKYMKNGSEVKTKMRKCDFCYDRFANVDLLAPPFVSTDGLTKSAKPSCQVTCPPGAITSGTADTMLNKAKKRVTYLKANGYPNAEVYPPQDGTWPNGLTRVIWVLTESRVVYGL